MINIAGGILLAVVLLAHGAALAHLAIILLLLLIAFGVVYGFACLIVYSGAAILYAVCYAVWYVFRYPCRLLGRGFRWSYQLLATIITAPFYRLRAGLKWHFPQFYSTLSNPVHSQYRDLFIFTFVCFSLTLTLALLTLTSSRLIP